METRIVDELIKAPYWDCGVENHRHKTKRVAEACIAKQASPKYKKWLMPDMVAALELVASGKTLAAAGRDFGVSAERMRQVVSKAARAMLHPARLAERHPSPAHARELANIRQNSDWWRRQISKFNREHAHKEPA